MIKKKANKEAYQQFSRRLLYLWLLTNFCTQFYNHFECLVMFILFVNILWRFVVSLRRCRRCRRVSYWAIWFNINYCVMEYNILDYIERYGSWLLFLFTLILQRCRLGILIKSTIYTPTIPTVISFPMWILGSNCSRSATHSQSQTKRASTRFTPNNASAVASVSSPSLSSCQCKCQCGWVPVPSAQV